MILSVLIGATACSGGNVVRVFDGVEVDGRFINDWAYASYARGVEWEERGRDAEALKFYEEARDQDPSSVEIWTRLGAVRCRLGGDAEDAFAAAEDRDADYEPLWRARARCDESRDKLESALVHARRAVTSDPSRDASVLLLARLAALNGEHEEAERWLRSVAVRSPRSRRVWQAIAAYAGGTDGKVLHPAWLAAAQRRLATMHANIDAPKPGPEPKLANPWSAVDAALIAGSLEDARRKATEHHLDARRLAARAIVVGRPALALDEATLRLGANPDDSDSRIALVLAADLLSRSDVALGAMTDIPKRADPLSEWGALMLAEIMVRHVGVEAAAEFLGTTPSELEGKQRPRARLVRALNKARS